MPFEKKKKYKTAKDYKQKNLYLNESDPYKYECFRLLELCGPEMMMAVTRRLQWVGKKWSDLKHPAF